MVDLLNSGTTVDSETAVHGIAQQKGRTGMNRRMNRRTATITIVSTLLLALLATATVARVFSLASVTRQAQVTQQDSDAAGMAGVVPIGAATSGSTVRDALGDTTVAGLREVLDGEQFAGAARAVRGAVETGPQEFLPGDRATSTLPIVRPGAGIGPIAFLPGEEGAGPVPSLVPDREAAPDFGPQP
jgi:hypothetical protein